jgi:hypothetical protein
MYQFVVYDINETISMKFCNQYIYIYIDCNQYISSINIGSASSPQGFMTVADCNIGAEIL